MCFRPSTAAKRENKCAKCGSVNPDEAVTCSECGAALPRVPPPPGVADAGAPRPVPRPGASAPPKAPPGP